MHSIQIYFVLFVVFLLGLLIRFIYERLKLTGRIDTKNKLIFSLIFVTMMLIWVSWFVMNLVDPWRFELPDIIHWSGITAFILGLVLALGALFQLKGVENIQFLATTGVFSRIRHPMYLGFILWILGWSLYNGAIFSMIPGIVGITNILYWRSLEDAEMKARYGETYTIYSKRTWF
jgi:protein-S-isoprenylcysteine O-methyltransferase Ste14